MTSRYLLFLFSLLLLAQATANAATETNRWENEIRAFEAADKTNPPPQNAVLFIGSSSIVRWPDLSEAFPGHTVFNRGFGGSELSDSVTYADRIVVPYRPRLVLLYAGDNDLADGKSAQQVFSDFKAFTARTWAALPKTEIAFISIKPCPLRKKLLPEVREANQLIKDYIAADPRLRYIDVFTPMLGPNDSMRPELFVTGGLHMNRDGYALWNSIIKPLLDQWDKPSSLGRP